ncbi:MAG: hypothetical protein ACQ9MH_12860 [Nitrospinales bacterium]
MAQKQQLFVVLTDDWELRGNGSGNIESLQLGPMRKLVALYNKHGIHGSFFAEMMQQLTFRKFQYNHPELRKKADQWDEQILETYRQGHDIQLHIHPQWSQALYENGTWTLEGDWSLINYAPEEAERMILEGKNYLETLLRSENPEYRCLAFRAGAWALAPSKHLLGILTRLGFLLDASIVGGIYYNTKNLQLDYSNCEETFLPFYPDMTDARKVSEKEEPIVCVPTCHFYEPLWKKFKDTFHTRGNQLLSSLIRNKSSAKFKGHSSNPENAVGKDWQSVTASYDKASTAVHSVKSKNRKRLIKTILKLFKKNHFIADLSLMDLEHCRCMTKIIRKKTQERDLDIPVIIENHTKDLNDLSHLDSFFKELAQADDINFMTLTNLTQELDNGRFPIQTK